MRSSTRIRSTQFEGLPLMISAFRRFCKLPPLERKMFVRGVLLLPITTWALRLVRIQTIMHRLGAGGRERLGPDRNQGETRTLAESAGRMIEAASRYGVIRGSCLSKSLVLWHLLRREDLSPTIRIGGRKDGKEFAAHAWVELDGYVINDSGGLGKDFVPFEEQPNGAWLRKR